MNLNNDILIEIFNYLQLSDLLKIRQLNFFFKKLVHSNKWSNILITLKNIKYFDYVITNYKFINYNLCFCYNITDYHIKRIKKYPYFKFSWLL